MPARGARAVLDVVGQDLVPVAHDQRVVTLGAAGRVSFFVVHVSGVHVLEPHCAGEPLGPDQGTFGGARPVDHLEIRVKCRKVEGHLGSDVGKEPLAEAFEFFVVVVQAGDEKRGDFHPYIGFVTDVSQRVQHRFKVPSGHFGVEVFTKRFEVDIGRGHVPEKLGPCLIRDVAGGDGDGLDLSLSAGPGDVDGIFQEDDRIVVGESQALAVVRPRGVCQGLGVSLALKPVEGPRLRDIPVLAELARQVAAGRSEGQHAGTGEKVIEGLFFDRVDHKTAASPIGREDDLVTLAFADKTEATLPLAEGA